MTALLTALLAALIFLGCVMFVVFLKYLEEHLP